MNGAAWGLICNHLHIYRKRRWSERNQAKFYLIQIRKTSLPPNVTDVNNSFIFATWSFVHLWGHFFLNNRIFFLHGCSSNIERRNQLRRVTPAIRMRIHFLSTSSKSLSAFLDHRPIFNRRHELRGESKKKVIPHAHSNE